MAAWQIASISIYNKAAGSHNTSIQPRGWHSLYPKQHCSLNAGGALLVVYFN